MFCYQCQETKNNSGCDSAGVCGKTSATASLQDTLLYATKGLSYFVEHIKPMNINVSEADALARDALFVTVTNVNFDDEAISVMITRIIESREKLKKEGRAQHTIDTPCACCLPEACLYNGGPLTESQTDFSSPAYGEKEDLRSLRELLLYGLKGVAAYARHASVLGYEDRNFYEFMHRALAYTIEPNQEFSALLDLVLECGEKATSVMALLDGANTKAFGAQRPTEVPRVLKPGKGILVSGHDLRDLYELLKQTENTGINVYTHGEMLAAHAYPVLSSFTHLAGHFGTAWHNQRKELAEFSGPVLFTTNCIQRPDSSYAGRMFTTGTTGYPGARHIKDAADGCPKNFASLIEVALESEDLASRDDGVFRIGYAKDVLEASAGKIIEEIERGAIKKFVVMAGCDGRHKERDYFTEIARHLPSDAVILTAGCAKFRYNHLNLGEINGIPRLIDAGQCNDCYSLAYIALKLKSALGMEKVSDLPLAFHIGWYEQKAMAVLLALLHLGFKNINVGPTLPAFLSPNVLAFLKSSFGLGVTGVLEEDLNAIAD